MLGATRVEPLFATITLHNAPAVLASAQLAAGNLPLFFAGITEKRAKVEQEPRYSEVRNSYEVSWENRLRVGVQERPRPTYWP